MYRSKRADRKLLVRKLKLAFVFILIFLAGGAVVLAQHLSDYEPETVNPEPATIASSVVLPAAVQPNFSTYENTYESPESADNPSVYFDDDYPEYDTYDGDEPFPRERKKIALTFDDGPVWLTNYLLDILDEYGGRVTFCVIGDMVENGADIVLRAFESGHEIIGHSWDHQDIARLSVEEIIEQIAQTSQIIEYVTGETPPPIFRVPFGRYNARIRDAAYYAGYGVLNWSLDPQDWRYRNEDHIYDYITQNAHHGAIVVLHDVHPTTVYAMARVIPTLIYQGFDLVTATEIIYYVYGGLEPGFEFTGTR
ncbi:MAG: polysaccharide deacetylase family protein [Defluviitaleaceae bacterium]|nr:polysaccharide deacetylase family protein [Defluviitaleaceae bacterium]